MDQDALQNALQILLDMGFEKTRAVKALILFGMNCESAITWLFNHESEPVIDNRVAPPSHVVTALGSFIPDRIAFQELLSIGFSEVFVLQALQLGQNNFNRACDLLLSGQNLASLLQLQKRKLEERVNPVLARLFENALIQRGLVDPLIVVALKNLIKNTGLWSIYVHQNSAIRPFLLQIYSTIDVVRKTTMR